MNPLSFNGNYNPQAVRLTTVKTIVEHLVRLPVAERRKTMEQTVSKLLDFISATVIIKGKFVLQLYLKEAGKHSMKQSKEFKAAEKRMYGLLRPRDWITIFHHFVIEQEAFHSRVMDLLDAPEAAQAFAPLEQVELVACKFIKDIPIFSFII